MEPIDFSAIYSQKLTKNKAYCDIPPNYLPQIIKHDNDKYEHIFIVLNKT